MNVSIYIALYYNFILLLVFYYSLLYKGNKLNGDRNSLYLLFLFVLLIFSFRPLDYAFGDTRNYAFQYNMYVDDGLFMLTQSKDYGFGLLTYALSFFDNVTVYFAVLCLLYTVPVMHVATKYVPEGKYTLFLLFVCSFSFFGFGVNGLRNGIATSLLIFAFFQPKLIYRVTIILFASTIHKSALLPGAVFLIAERKPNVNWYLKLWGICLFLSIFAHGPVSNYLQSLDMMSDSDSRFTDYMTSQFGQEAIADVEFSRTGFRWDFLLYSVIPIWLGYKYITKYKFNNALYNSLYCCYLGANAFWLFTIYQPFNNRFAYLSWFLYPIIISYPLLVQKNLIPRQHQRLRNMVLINFAFTYLMWLRQN